MISNRWRSAVVAGAILLLAGCSSSTAGSAAAPPPDTPEEWVAQFCGAVLAFQVDVEAATAERLPSDVAERKARMVEVLDILGNELDEVADDVDSLGTPPVDDLESDVGEFTDALRRSASDIEDLEQEARDLDETRAALDAFGAEADQRIDEALEPVAAFDLENESAELTEIADDVPECGDIDL